MIETFRKFFSSKIGLGITLAFLALIAFAFASSDVANTGTFGGVAGGDRVAVVGDKKLGTADLSQSASSALDQMRQQDPTLSMRAFIEQGGLDRVLDRLIDRTAIGEYARKYGLRAGTNLVNSEIIQIPAFRGADGNFSQEAYEGLLRQQGLSDATVRDDLATGLLTQQLAVPASFGTSFPGKIAARYAELLRERRQGTIATLPSMAFAPQGKPSNGQINAFYEANRADFIRPERRVVRYVTFGMDALDTSIEPTDNELAARFSQNKAQYAASEERMITQIIVPTEQGAKALRDQVSAGASFASVAQQAGFRPSQLGPLSKAELTEQSSAAVANAVFAASQGSIANPVRSALGWHVVRVDNIDSIPARTLADVRGELAEAIRAEKRRAAIADLSARVEEEIDDGMALADMAEQLGRDVQVSQPLTADGRVYGAPAQAAPQELAAALSTAFQMQEGEPQLAEVVPGQLFLIFEVGEITESAPAPLAEIRDQIEARWRMEQGAKGARAAADRILARLAKGETLAAAISAEDASLPAPDSIDLNRQQLAQQMRGQVPAPLALMFSMAQGTSKKLEGPNDTAWFVIDLERVSVEKVASGDPIIEQTRRELAQSAGDEYFAQLVTAMREEVGVERNQSAVDAVRKLLVGES